MQNWWQAFGCRLRRGDGGGCAACLGGRDRGHRLRRAIFVGGGRQCHRGERSSGPL